MKFQNWGGGEQGVARGGGLWLGGGCDGGGFFVKVKKKKRKVGPGVRGSGQQKRAGKQGDVSWGHELDVGEGVWGGRLGSWGCSEKSRELKEHCNKQKGGSR